MINLSYSGKLTINLVILFGVMIGCSLFYFFPYLKGFKKLKFKDFFRTNIDRLIVSSIFLIGILIRTIFLDLLPGGLNQDEASAGYDAFSIMYYGVDRNGFHLPIYLTAWGSGQNALYSYLSMPFIGIFGLNELSLRLPAAIISWVSLDGENILLKVRNYDFSMKLMQERSTAMSILRVLPNLNLRVVF